MDMDNRKTSADVVFEYTGECSVPKDVTSVQFKEGLKTIWDRAFSNCKSLESITLPTTLIEIGTGAFSGCTLLERIIFHEGLQTIRDGAFRDCSSLKSIRIPSTLVEISDDAFYGCSNLREVTLNEGLQKIGAMAFHSCESLESITLPSTVTEIGNSAFSSCSNLREVLFNDGLQKIGIGTFWNCTSLESINLPSSLVEISKLAFRSCSNLREVEMKGVPQNVKSDAFYNCAALERFLFPTISYRLENLIQTDHWEDLGDKVNEVRGVVQWESDKLFVSTAHNWNGTRRDLGRIARLVSYYELKEATTAFELAMWKYKLDQADETNTTNRDAYRIDVPGPVKDTMLQYLGHI